MERARPFGDTRPEAERLQIELLRQLPPHRKLEMVAQMNEAVRTLALEGLRQRHPHDSPQQLRRRLADLLLGPELAERVYGPLSEKDTGDDSGSPRGDTAGY